MVDEGAVSGKAGPGLWTLKSLLVPAAARRWDGPRQSPGKRRTGDELPSSKVVCFLNVFNNLVFPLITFSVAQRHSERSICAERSIGPRLQSRAGGFRTPPASPIRAPLNAVGSALSVIHPNKAGQPHIPEVLGLLIVYSGSQVQLIKLIQDSLPHWLPQRAHFLAGTHCALLRMQGAAPGPC